MEETWQERASREIEARTIGRYTCGVRHEAMGRTSVAVTCSCGVRRTAYVWSWAGHGCLKCRGCGGLMDYRSDRVLRPYEKPKRVGDGLCGPVGS